MSGDDQLWCRVCEQLRPADLMFCPEHSGVELVDPPAAEGGTGQEQTQEELACPVDGELHPAGLIFCPDHHGAELVPPRPSSAADDNGPQDGDDSEPDQRRTVCWKCGTRAVDATNDACARCHESLVPPALVIDFPDGPVVLTAPGMSADLGRAGTHSHVFARYPNVSRWHATVTVDGQGDAWITPNHAAPNGTFVNGDEIVHRTALAPGDELRFAAGEGARLGPVSDRIRQPRREPEPAPGS
ncbi:FHA domain-containing protein [Dactylosporangium sp. NPDC005555]|uniref:FHA domain-containing protein n=1 Tax=Dactylosporangium sp. NPDC005555 TaxID=3154889 RepID=UPI0033A40E36